MKLKKRYVLSLGVVGAAVLALGAGRFTAVSISRSESVRKSGMEVSAAVMELRRGIPESGREAWIRLVKENPEVFAKACGRVAAVKK